MAEALTAGSCFAAIMAEAQTAAFPAAQATDALSPADDAAVITALRDGGAGSLSARLAARFDAISEALRMIQLTLNRESSFAGMTAAAVAEGEGFAAVETARGRLYHLARLDKSDRIVDYGFVAPTEWNFHCNGPLAATLLGAELGSTARLDIERLASVFDPCVTFETELRETADA